MTLTPTERSAAFLAVTGIIGGGAVSYFGTQAALKGGLFGTDPHEKPKATAGTYALGIVGAGLLFSAYREAAEEIGWTPIVTGSAVLFGLGLLAR